MSSPSSNQLKDGPAPGKAGLQEEMLYESNRTYVARRQSATGPVVVKRAIGQDATRRLRHERSILGRLTHVEGVARLVTGHWGDDSLAMKDEGGITLAQALAAQPFTVDGVLQFALAMARTLCGVHGAGIVHKDINPSNILVCGPERRPVLIDFNIAMACDEEEAAEATHHHIAGTMAYMPPEQTGRTGQPVDRRSDLYALGAVLFQLVSGRPVFETNDLLDLLHCQLTTVPPSLASLVPAVPPVLSAMVARLLDKQADRRYQSAEGVVHDLERLIAQRAGGQSEDFEIGMRDFAARLIAPARPVGRTQELSVLDGALVSARHGDGVCVLLSGPAGMGKTSLVNELRGYLAESRGRFISGRFEPHRREGATATVQAMRALGKLLLSEPEDELALVRERLTSALGANITAGLARVPEFELLLGQQPELTAEPMEAEKRMFQACVDTLACLASSERPLVMLLDDAQWAPAVSLRFIDAILAARPRLKGFVLVVAYRHPNDEELAAHLQAWRQLPAAPQELALAPLPQAAVTELLADMLRLPADEAGQLANVLSERAAGNPQETIELVNALRLDGLLSPGPHGWQWEAQAIRHYVGDNEGVDLLDRRLAKLPAECVQLMELVACLGGEVSQALLATGHAAAANTDTLALLRPAIDDGLMVAEENGSAVSVRLRNNRVHERLHDRLKASGRKTALQQELARRLAPHEAFRRLAAEQYLQVHAHLSDPDECRRAAALLLSGARAAKGANFTACEQFATAGVAVLKHADAPADAPLMLALMQLRHLALYSLGRHEDADAAYADIAARCTDARALASSAGMQILSMTNRDIFAEALALGLGLLERLGLPQPADMAATLGVGIRKLAIWAVDPAKSADITRPEASDPAVLDLAQFIQRVLTPAFNIDKTIYTWLLTEAQALWVQHGPCTPLMSCMASVPMILASTTKNYDATYSAARHIIDVGTARGYGSGTAKAEVIAGLCATHWGQPVEDIPAYMWRARPGLLLSGDTQYATYTYAVSVLALFESARTLDDSLAEIQALDKFERDTGTSRFSSSALTLWQLLRAMRGETHRLGDLEDDGFNAEDFLKGAANIPTQRPGLRATQCAVSLIFNDQAALDRYSAEAFALVDSVPGFYAMALIHLYRAMALAELARNAADADREALLTQMDVCRAFVAARAQTSPTNFAHWVSWLEAERAWAGGETWTAVTAFEQALEEIEQRSRPWHKALIHERFARFYLSHGWERTARPWLIKAMNLYEEWGASGKVTAMLAEFPFLRNATSSRNRPSTVGGGTIVSTDMVDMMAILRASQALSSETSLALLNERVAKVLGAICGAESVLLMVRPREMPGWFLATSLEQGQEPLTLETAAAQGALPLTAFRYAERTREPLLLEDATRDHRFATDPALIGVPHCSLLIVPILKQGELQAMLVLESRMRHSAFSADRLDSVSLIAGQLAVSLDNALLYASLESKVNERTAALADANRQLERLSVTDPLTGLANRRHFDQALAVEWTRAVRTGTPLGVAMIDIDEFKQYNDHYGHQGGDVCLQLVADVMKQVLRVNDDVIARYGGEEFVLLLRDSDLEATRVVAERTRAAVAACLQPHVKAKHGIVTVSIGIASCIPTRESAADECVAAADKALYEAKRAGRNRVAASEQNSQEGES